MTEFPPGQGLETYSLKKRRVYERKFDHEEARRLHSEGMALHAIARHFGVSDNAVRRVVDLEFREMMDKKTRAWIEKTKRAPCLGGCGTRVWLQNQARTGYCHRCLPAKRNEWTVREGELLCRRCEQWKPDRDFPLNRKSKRRKDGTPSASRRGRDPWCRSCATAVRRAHRHAHPEQEKRQNQRVMQKRREAKMADYIVLDKVGELEYHEIGRCEASSPDIAIEKLATEEGAYVAVLTSRFEVVEVAPTTSLRVQRK